MRRRRARRRAPSAVVRAPSYYVVAGVALDLEMERLRAPGGVRRRTAHGEQSQAQGAAGRARPNRLGFAVPTEFRLSVTAYPGIRPGDILETLLHELVHLHVGRAPEAHAWHGPTFKRTLAWAMDEAFGLSDPSPRSTQHGYYADAIELALAARPPLGPSPEKPPG